MLQARKHQRDGEDDPGSRCDARRLPRSIRRGTVQLRKSFTYKYVINPNTNIGFLCAAAAIILLTLSMSYKPNRDSMILFDPSSALTSPT